ncbi:hypothetical protein G7B40_016555 [Aetokthonos hydrillicola Thurmond2011]|jgi:catechol 2,3-dioxygenase-like lactoylglutathione lyase family enzyme|uniref:Glyoxalase/fosfomycin resistance/dioxygenase domain-containing protein n=1 Tax=Aetokthonos hydrillicola Thurmond2011 TaxID=2712845 RepID=A0AAP5IBR9_9CYAN|nr:VOC family protein [Aetokthonos hydrillicola]MBO3458789.1 hypothetical protein [Aetokthonos hydrillicola CCALA 1050]MBW4585536.1 hypothetical protein [Aetokthonos hydrillicola CCALA 1050]MDR9896160.1 hypothetical protein [Aetokthonos hydrillicola Thurmond2011]
MVFQYTDALITIATLDIEKMVCFYTQFLQKQPEHFIPNTYAEFQLPGMKLSIFKPKPTHLSEFQTSANSKISLCLEINDLESAIAHLTTLGNPPVGEIIVASHGREIYAYDPDNNRIILHESTDSRGSV